MYISSRWLIVSLALIATYDAQGMVRLNMQQLREQYNMQQLRELDKPQTKDGRILEFPVHIPTNSRDNLAEIINHANATEERTGGFIRYNLKEDEQNLRIEIAVFKRDTEATIPIYTVVMPIDQEDENAQSWQTFLKARMGMIKQFTYIELVPDLEKCKEKAFVKALKKRLSPSQTFSMIIMPQIMAGMAQHTSTKIARHIAAKMTKNYYLAMWQVNFGPYSENFKHIMHKQSYTQELEDALDNQEKESMKTVRQKRALSKEREAIATCTDTEKKEELKKSYNNHLNQYREQLTKTILCP